MSEFQITLIVYCWVLILVYRWDRKKNQIMFIPALFVAVFVAILFYLPLIVLWVLRTFFMLT